MQDSGVRYSSLPKTSEIYMQTFLQKCLIQGQSNMQWQYDPSEILHLLKYLESEGFYLFRSTGVIWSIWVF